MIDNLGPINSECYKGGFVGLGLRFGTGYRLAPIISNRARLLRDHTVRARSIDMMSAVGKQSETTSAEMWVAVSKMTIRLVSKSGIVSSQADPRSHGNLHLKVLSVQPSSIMHMKAR